MGVTIRHRLGRSGGTIAPRRPHSATGKSNLPAHSDAAVKVNHVRAISNAAYPGRTGSSGPRFMADDSDYERAANDKTTTRRSYEPT